MITKYNTEIEELAAESRFWVYLSSRFFTDQEVEALNNRIREFTSGWTAHNNQLKATGWIEFNCYLILVADETKSGASGCSIDKSVRFIRELGLEFETDWFDRLIFVYLDEGQNPVYIHKSNLQTAFESGTINDKTLFVNSLVKNKLEYKHDWLIPFVKSWHKRLL